MKKEINNLLDCLYSMAKSNTYNEKNADIRKIIYILEKISKDETITVEELDLVQKLINDLNCKYDDVFELTNIFQPIHYFYKKKIKKEHVNKLRQRKRYKIDFDKLKYQDDYIYKSGYRIVYFYENGNYHIGEYCKTIEGFMVGLADCDPVIDEDEIPKFVSTEDLLNKSIKFSNKVIGAALYRVDGTIVDYIEKNSI